MPIRVYLQKRQCQLVYPYSHVMVIRLIGKHRVLLIIGKGLSREKIWSDLDTMRLEVSIWELCKSPNSQLTLKRTTADARCAHDGRIPAADAGNNIVLDTAVEHAWFVSLNAELCRNRAASLNAVLSAVHADRAVRGHTFQIDPLAIREGNFSKNSLD